MQSKFIRVPLMCVARCTVLSVKENKNLVTDLKQAKAGLRRGSIYSECEIVSAAKRSMQGVFV